jgi:prepilin-type N-terminal cleavage/methylation domain-containing protein
VSGAPCRGSGPSRGGFTLIEVIGALVIFSLGVIMVLQLSTALSTRMEYASRSGEIVTRAQERLDSLETLPFDSLTPGSDVDTLTVQGIGYLLTASVTAVTGVLYQIDVTMAPSVSGAGPSFTATSYAVAEW